MAQKTKAAIERQSFRVYDSTRATLRGEFAFPSEGSKIYPNRRPKSYIDAHIDSRLPQLRDGVPNLGERAADWAGVWHLDDAAGLSRDDPSTEQPEPAGDTDKSLFTRKTNPRDSRRMAEVKRRITVGKDLSTTEREQVDALLDEFVDVFSLSMSEVYVVPGAEHRLDMPVGATIKTKVRRTAALHFKKTSSFDHTSLSSPNRRRLRLLARLKIESTPSLSWYGWGWRNGEIRVRDQGK